MKKDARALKAFLTKKKLIFCGFGVSHRELVRQYAAAGADVCVCDKKSPEELGEEALALRAAGVRFSFGPDYLSPAASADADTVVFRTPGMKFGLPELQAARRNGAAVTSETELFAEYCPCRIFGVTGSDGKTTTTTLISEMLKAAGIRVHLGGNIGTPLLPILEEVREDDAAVIELSSFQLISMRHSPDVAVVTNLAENHLDVHASMEEYVNAKKNIFLHQGAFSRTVLNRDNAITRGFAEEVRGETAFFSRFSEPENGVFLRDDTIYVARYGEVTELLRRDEIRLPGIHNAENLMAAAAAVWGFVPAEAVRKTAREFAGVEHRIEFVREVGGVRYYNDSIATSPTRTKAGLRALDRKVVLLAGGYDKNLDYAPLAEDLIRYVKLLILSGPTADKIEAAVRARPEFASQGPEIVRAEDLPAAVRLAAERARPGDTVLLSPASASFDRYPNFEVRGRHFKELVAAL